MTINARHLLPALALVALYFAVQSVTAQASGNTPAAPERQSPAGAAVAPPRPASPNVASSLQTVDIDSGRVTTVLTEQGRLMAPNWSRDGKTLVFTQGNRIATIPVAGGTPQLMDVGNLIGCSGSHGLSPDGKWFAVTCGSTELVDRRVYILPATGGTPRLLTQSTAWFHSWSPDGKTILFTRGGGPSIGNFFAISVDGGPETALTTGTDLNDDPDYSSDGKYIYFNTNRWGGMQIGRMRPDGSQVEQITFDEFKNWTPHPSPDGKSIVFISYEPSVTTHAANKDIVLRILSTSDNKIRTLVHLVGGDGSMNVANWSPDSKSLAFVSYQVLPAKESPANQ